MSYPQNGDRIVTIQGGPKNLYQATYLYELLQMTHSRTGIVAKLFSVIT